MHRSSELVGSLASGRTEAGKPSLLKSIAATARYRLAAGGVLLAAAKATEFWKSVKAAESLAG
jgi:hypothetical protein